MNKRNLFSTAPLLLLGSMIPVTLQNQATQAASKFLHEHFNLYPGHFRPSNVQTIETVSSNEN
jgi:hypothetical protein